jgi:hypothetical protein
MSSFQQRKTTISDQAALCEALTKMGHKPVSQDNKQPVRGHYNETRKAEVILKKEDLKQGGDVGFTKTADGTFEIVADTYVMHGFDLGKFQKELTQEYAAAKVMKQAKVAGLTMTGKTRAANGNTVYNFVKA